MPLAPTCQALFRNLLDGGEPGQVNHHVCKALSVATLTLGKVYLLLSYGTAFFAYKAVNFHLQHTRLHSEWNTSKTTEMAAGACHITTPATRTAIFFTRGFYFYNNLIIFVPYSQALLFGHAKSVVHYVGIHILWFFGHTKIRITGISYTLISTFMYPFNG